MHRWRHEAHSSCHDEPILSNARARASLRSRGRQSELHLYGQFTRAKLGKLSQASPSASGILWPRSHRIIICMGHVHPHFHAYRHNVAFCCPRTLATG